MKPLIHVLVTSLFFLLSLSLPLSAQKIDVAGEAIVGAPGDGNNLLTLRSERPWVFRQIGTGPGTNLELYSTVGLKNFVINFTGNMGIGVLLPIEKLHVGGNIKATGATVSFGSSEYVRDAGSFLIECNGTFQSSVDGTDNLGGSARRWNSIWAFNGTINTSDAKTKSNIHELTYGLQDILQLRPVAFNWKDRPETGPKLGLIAQEVQKVIPEVVVDRETVRDEATGAVKIVPSQHLGIYYSDLIPVLIRGMQQQQQIIEEKEQRITELEGKVKKLEALEERIARLEQSAPRNTETEVLLEGSGSAYIRQNAPNPFDQNTSIEYFLPEDTRNAYLRVNDAAGKVLKMIKLENTGRGHINLSAGELPGGSYAYTLIINGAVVDTRLMQLTGK